VHAIEALDRARHRTQADDLHAERLAFRRQNFGDGADAENADGLVVQELRRPALPLVLVLQPDGARKIARQRQHGGEGGFRDRRAMDAVDVGDDHVAAQRRAVDQVVDAGAERLHPLEPLRLLQNMVGQHGREGHERIGRRNVA
jgi:hypothetical protein